MAEVVWNQSFYNLTWDTDLEIPDEPDPKSRLAAGLGSLVCVAIILSNISLISSLISSGQWKKEPYRIILAHLSFLDVSVGILSIPLLLHYVLVGYWAFGRIICTMWMAVDHFLLVLIQISWLILSIDRLLFAFRPQQYRAVVKPWVAFLMIWIPWSMSCVVAGPLYYMSFQDEYVPRTECYSDWQLHFYLMFIVLTFFVPFGFSLVVLILCIIVVLLSRNVTISQPTSSSINANKSLATKSTLVMGLTNMSFLVMWLPFFAITLSDIQSAYRNDVENWVISLLYWIVYSNSAVRPILWFVLKDIKYGFLDLFLRICGRKRSSLDQCTQTKREKEVRFIDFDCSKLKSADV